MIAATYDCGCKPTINAHGHPNCFESLTSIGNGPRYTLLRCQTTAPPPSCPNTGCCKPVRCGIPPSCGFVQNCRVLPSCGVSPSCVTVAPQGCPNFQQIYNCHCTHEPPELPDFPEDCTCGLEEVKSCKLDEQGLCDPCETPKPERIVSNIVRRGKPYKEIEAIINNNRMVIRLQKEEFEDEFDPPCDCPGVDPVGNESQLELQSSKRYGDDIVYEMSDYNRMGFSCPQGQSSMVRQSCDQQGKGGRTITLYPHPGTQQKKLPEPIVEKEKIEKRDKRGTQEKSKMTRITVDHEENPNIFILRIRKRSNNSEGKQKLDVEFRTPRPWLPRKEPIKCPRIQEQIQISQQDVAVKKCKASRRCPKGQKKKKGKKRKKQS